MFDITFLIVMPEPRPLETFPYSHLIFHLTVAFGYFAMSPPPLHFHMQPQGFSWQVIHTTGFGEICGCRKHMVWCWQNVWILHLPHVLPMYCPPSHVSVCSYRGHWPRCTLVAHWTAGCFLKVVRTCGYQTCRLCRARCILLLFYVMQHLSRSNSVFPGT